MIYPSIEKDGSISEVTIGEFKSGEVYVRTSVGEGGLITHERFRVQDFAFQVDDSRRAHVQVMISEDFPQGAIQVLKDGKATNQDIQQMRKYEISRFIDHHSPWLFSYATRKTAERPQQCKKEILKPS